MGIITTRTVVCDECNKEIPDGVLFVDAGVYGKVFHTYCFDEFGGPDVIERLELDDLSLERVGEDGESVARKSGLYRRHWKRIWSDRLGLEGSD